MGVAPGKGEQLATLRTELARAQGLFDSIEVRADRVLVDHTVARFLWRAIADAHLVLLAVENNRWAALSPVLRHLFETTHDVMHLVAVAEDPESFAAGSLVGELVDQHRQATKRREITDKNAKLAGPGDRGSPPPPIDDRFEQAANELETLGHDTKTLRGVYDQNRDRRRSKRRVHCTGKDRVSLIKETLMRFSGDENDVTDVANQLEWLWRETSASGRAHSSPGWLTHDVEQDPKTGRFDSKVRIRHLERAGYTAAGLLKIVTNFSGQHFSGDSGAT